MQPNLAKLFCECSPLWLHHKILKRTLLKLSGDFCLIKKIPDIMVAKSRDPFYRKKLDLATFGQ
jgi:hypothetical protein